MTCFFPYTIYDASVFNLTTFPLLANVQVNSANPKLFHSLETLVINYLKKDF